MCPKGRSARVGTDSTPALRCSFCGKAQGEVLKLIAGPQVFICDECVAVCADMVAREREAEEQAALVPPERQPRGSEQPSFLTVACALCATLTPAGDLLWVRERGMLCPGCVSEVEAAAAEARRTKP